MDVTFAPIGTSSVTSSWSSVSPGTITITNSSANTITNSGTITITSTGPKTINLFDLYIKDMRAWNYLYRSCFAERYHVIHIEKPRRARCMLFTAHKSDRLPQVIDSQDMDMEEVMKGQDIFYLQKYVSGLKPKNSQKSYYFDVVIRNRILDFLAPEELHPLKKPKPM